MSERTARRVMVRRVAQERGYSVPPAHILIKGQWYDTRSGNRVSTLPTAPVLLPKVRKRMGVRTAAILSALFASVSR